MQHASTLIWRAIPRDSHVARSCFTLIELLVVIAIIAILAAMLLPALSNARAQGKKITCVNNQKQILIGLGMYTEESEGYYPHMLVTPGRRHFPDYLTDLGILKAEVDPAIATPYICPVIDVGRYNVNGPTDVANTYGMNYWLSGYVNNNVLAVVPIQPKRITNAASRILTGDGYFDTIADYGHANFTQEYMLGGFYDTSRWDLSGYIYWNHAGRPVGGFVDGHTETRTGPWFEGLR
jgi:prepilin-type N-terminal cleavage/methylation domain-containing protein